MQKTSDNPLSHPREPGPNLAAMRSLSNTALVEEAARKALSAQELDRTLDLFRRLCTTPGEDVGLMEHTAETLRNAGFKQELMQILRDALTLPEANPQVGALWVRRIVTSKIWNHRYLQDIDALCKHGEVGRRAVIEFLELVGPKRRAHLVQQAVARHAKWLRTDPRGWAATGRALARSRCYGQAAKWMSNWRKQPDLDLPTLHCLALAMRASGRAKEEAEAVIRLALSKPGAPELFPVLQIWIAQDKAFAGETQDASVTFKQINNVGLDDDSLALYYLVRGVIRVQKADQSTRKEAFVSASQRVADLFRKIPIYKRDVFVRREYRRCFTRMAKDSGAWSQAIPAVWRSAESFSFLFPLLVIPGLQLLLPCYLYRLCARRRGVNK